MWIKNFFSFLEVFGALSNIYADRSYKSVESRVYDVSRTVGGYSIDITQAPYMAVLNDFCGASIISSNWIITAAHCTEGLNAELLNVRVGSTNKLHGGEIFKVKNLIEHPRYNNMTLDYDFALLQLDGSIDFNERKQPVKLPELDDYVRTGDICYVSGWGKNLNSYENSDALHEVELPLINKSDCIDRYAYEITDRMICTGYFKGGNENPNVGDAGGPLVNVNQVLMGIVSFGASDYETPGVYAYVPAVRDWINEQTGL